MKKVVIVILGIIILPLAYHVLNDIFVLIKSPNANNLGFMLGELIILTVLLIPEIIAIKYQLKKKPNTL